MATQATETTTQRPALGLEKIEHRATRVRRPQSNGFVERLHHTLLDERFRLKRA